MSTKAWEDSIRSKVSLPSKSLGPIKTVHLITKVFSILLSNVCFNIKSSVYPFRSILQIPGHVFLNILTIDMDESKQIEKSMIIKQHISIWFIVHLV